MKRFTLTAAVLAAIVFTGIFFYSYATNGSGAQNITPSITTSRFLMFGAPYTVRSELKGDAGVSENGVFRIDTYTGKVWILNSSTTPEGQPVRKWQEIEDK